ncbi:MAG: hypothetical protein JO321_03390 [Solirubrobacterales bacterium]|nr:hypothetical protein [Solirubrobacterales bacterium]
MSKRCTTRKTSPIRGTASSTPPRPKTRVVAASLVARDNLISSVRDLTLRYGTRTGLEREVKPYERRGVTARDRLERRLRRTRTLVERDLRQRRRRVERTMRQNRRGL